MSNRHRTLRETKLVKLLMHFSKVERRLFNEFVQASFFNKNPKLSNLYAFLYKGLSINPIPAKDPITFELAFKHIFPNETYKKERITKLCSKLFKLVERFIVIQKIENSQAEGQLLLLDYYNQHYLNDYYQVVDKNIRKLSENMTLRNNDYYRLCYNIEGASAKFLSTQLDDGRGDVNFQQTTSLLDIYYLSKKLEQACQMKNRQRTTLYPYSFDLMEEIMTFLPRSPYFKIPIIQIWYYAFLLLDEPQLSHYQKLKELLQEHNNLLLFLERRILYTYLENSCAKVMGTPMRYYAELFDLYKLQLKKEIIYTNGYLIPMIFRNIITVALKLEEIDWAEQFLLEHQDRIIPDYIEKEDMVSLCKALVLFEQQKYEEALNYLNLLKYNNIYTKLDERRIRLKIYYELSYEDLFDDLVNSFRKFISKNQKQINEVFIQLNRNFVNMVNKLNMHHTFSTGEEQKQFRKEMQEMNLLAEKNWLLGKLKEEYK